MKIRQHRSSNSFENSYAVNDIQIVQRKRACNCHLSVDRILAFSMVYICRDLHLTNDPQQSLAGLYSNKSTVIADE